MHVKTFAGPSPHAVMTLIKQELGSEAVILSSRETVRDGKKVHEVVAGVDRLPVMDIAPSSPYAKTMPTPRVENKADDFFSPSMFSQNSQSASPPGWGEWHKEWARVKEHLYTLMRPSIQWAALSPRQRVALEFLQREGVEDDMVLDIYKRLGANPNSSILDVLGEMVEVRPWGAQNWREAIHVVTGPFGSGKTTTLIRMALSLKKEIPDVKIAVINGDAARGTGRLVLRHWAELSDFMYLEALNSDYMRRALRTANAADVIFIDTPGVNRQGNLVTNLSNLGVMNIGAACHLVLQPYFATMQLMSMIERYKSGLNGSVIWSKLDEAVTFAPILNVARHVELPTSALSYGPGLRGTFSSVSHKMLWLLLFKQELPQSNTIE